VRTRFCLRGQLYGLQKCSVLYQGTTSAFSLRLSCPAEGDQRQLADSPPSHLLIFNLRKIASATVEGASR
jgi:hypothetical protein